MVTVGDLKKLLAKYPDDLPVILSSDSEGNWYSTLYDVDEIMYLANEVYPTNKQIEADTKGYYSDEDLAPEDAIRAVALWP